MGVALPTIGRFKQVNSCGGCTACCTEIGVKDLGKPPRCRCEHQRDGGCGIYGKHPQECRKYACVWAMGALGSNDKFRPDKCGVLLTLNNTAEGRSIGVFLLTSDADPERVRYLISRVRDKYPGYPITLIHPHGVPVGAGFECKPPYPMEMSNRPNLFSAHVKDPNTRVCEGPADVPAKSP